MNEPVKKFRVGQITAAVWQNQRDNGEGVYHNVKLQKSYKDKDGNWQHTDNFVGDDILKASVALRSAYEWIAVKS